MPDMRPFAAVCRMATPVNLNHPWLHLDGITAHLQYLRAAGRDYYTLPSKTVVSQPDHGPPLYLKTNGVRHASVSLFAPDLPLKAAQYYKRFEPDGCPGTARVDLGSGHYRNYMLRAVLQPCETVTFYGCGDINKLRELLADLTHLGNDIRVGWGLIAGMTVREVAEDWSLTRDGRATRPIPVRLLRRYSDQVRLAWHAPYWARESVDLCAPPGAEVEWA